MNGLIIKKGHLDVKKKALFSFSLKWEFILMNYFHCNTQTLISSPWKKSLLAMRSWKFLITVITGATDGIGKGYAFELARKGFSILLISRTQSRLDDVKAQIEKETSSEVIQLFWMLK